VKYNKGLERVAMTRTTMISQCYYRQCNGSGTRGVRLLLKTGHGIPEVEDALAIPSESLALKVACESNVNQRLNHKSMRVITTGRRLSLYSAQGGEPS
jgi:hypothetical protein